MPTIYADCPRCGFENRKFEAKSSNDITTPVDLDQLEKLDYYYSVYELFAVCGECGNATIFTINEKYNEEHDAVMHCKPPMDIEQTLNNCFDISGFVRLRDNFMPPSPKFVPKDVRFFFQEGTACLSNETWNAAGTMFRICLELAVKDNLTKEALDALKKADKNDLFDKINKLFDDAGLTNDLKRIATLIRQDGNKSAHGIILTKDDAMELLDFTFILLENVYTIPAKIKDSEERRKVKTKK